MNIARFFRSLNVFATIRSLRVELTSVRDDLETARDSACYLRDRRDELRLELASLANTLDGVFTIVDIADQAIDAFMDERSELQDQVIAAHIAGLSIAEELVNAQEAYGQVSAEGQQVMLYVRRVSDALQAAGITVAQGTNDAPLVTINEDAFFTAARNSEDLGDGNRRLLAA